MLGKKIEGLVLRSQFLKRGKQEENTAARGMTKKCKHVK